MNTEESQYRGQSLIDRMQKANMDNVRLAELLGPKYNVQFVENLIGGIPHPALERDVQSIFDKLEHPQAAIQDLITVFANGYANDIRTVPQFSHATIDGMKSGKAPTERKLNVLKRSWACFQCLDEQKRFSDGPLKGQHFDTVMDELAKCEDRLSR